MKRILVNCEHRETRVAVTEMGKLVELIVERSVEQRLIGNVYKAKVANILPGMQAAFVNIGLEKNGFLFIDDCLSPEEKEKHQKRKINIREVLTQGQELLVQVTKEPFGTKGARLTTEISFPGRLIVYMPKGNQVGVSRKIENEEERVRLLKLAQSLCQDGEGIIVRTVGEGAREEEIRADLLFLRGIWANAKQKIKSVKMPSLIHQDLDMISRIARDFLTEDVDEFIIDNAPVYNKVIDQLSIAIPYLKGKLKLFRDRTSLFETYELEREIEKSLQKKVWLKSGGYLIIDQTEALTVVDVNTGKFTGTQALEDTVFKTNKEAAREIARQLRLRDIGGIIIIDLIDMAKLEHRGEVKRLLEDELQKDRTKSHILGYTRLGLLEMTRKKVRHNLVDTLMSLCSVCEGFGKVISEETIAGKIEREIIGFAKGKHVDALLVEARSNIALELAGITGEHWRRMESEWGMKLYLKENDQLPQPYHIAFAGSEAEVKKRL